MTTEHADDRLDALLRSFLAERATDTAGMPSAERIAAGIAGGGATIRLGPRLAVRPLWLAATIGLLVLLGAALLLVGGRRADMPDTSGGWIAYTSEPGDAGGASQIHIAQPGQAPRRIAGDDAGSSRNVCPAFSPDGTMLAYGEGTDLVSGDSGGVSRRRAIVILQLDEDAAVDGPPIRLPVTGTGPAPCPKWSPDSTRLAYDLGFRVAITNLDGTVTGTAWRRESSDLAWSPDGSALAVTGPGGTWVVPADGGPPRSVSDGPSASVDWAPDGSRLVVEGITHGTTVARRWVGGSISIIGVDPPSGRVDIGPGLMPAWSPSGDWIAYLRDCPSTEGQHPTAAQLIVMRPDGSETQVLADDCDNGLAGWSADGRQVLHADRLSDRAWTVIASSPTGTDPSETLVQAMETGDRWVVPDASDVTWQRTGR